MESTLNKNNVTLSDRILNNVTRIKLERVLERREQAQQKLKDRRMALKTVLAHEL